MCVCVCGVRGVGGGGLGGQSSVVRGVREGGGARTGGSSAS